MSDNLESNELEKIAFVFDVKILNKNIKQIIQIKHNKKTDKQKRVDYVANRRKEKLLFTG